MPRRPTGPGIQDKSVSPPPVCDLPYIHPGRPVIVDKLSIKRVQWQRHTINSHYICKMDYYILS